MTGNTFLGVSVRVCWKGLAFELVYPGEEIILTNASGPHPIA